MVSTSRCGCFIRSFSPAFCTPHAPPHLGLILQALARLRGVLAQVLLLFFSGHGVRMHGQQHAIGNDANIVNVNKRFVQALKKRVSNCAIILLMDACGDAVHADAAEKDMHLEHLVKGVRGNDENLNGNLIVCAYACQVCTLHISVPRFALFITFLPPLSLFMEDPDVPRVDVHSLTCASAHHGECCAQCR